MKTPLAEEWEGVADSDGEEISFCETAARLGLDPYSVSDETADRIINAAAVLPAEIAGDFFDSADAGNLGAALDWTRSAVLEAGRTSALSEGKSPPVTTRSASNPSSSTSRQTWVSSLMSRYCHPFVAG